MTLLSLAISILYFILPSFSEVTNWIAVVVGLIYVILIALECLEADYLYKQILVNYSPPLPYSRKIHLMLTCYDITTQPSNRGTLLN